MWMLAIRLQLWTLSELDLDRIHHFLHALLQEKDTCYLLEGNQLIPNALRRIQSGGDYKALLCCPLLSENHGILPHRLVLDPGTGLSM